MNIFSNSQKENPLVCILDLLGVKHTSKYTNKHYNEHPYKYTMFGLSKMLSHYGVENIGVKIEDKDIQKLEAPFIAHIGKDFVTVEKITEGSVTYFWNSQKLEAPIDKFKEIWTGATLLVETNENSIEPDYKKNKKEEFITNIQLSLLSVSLIILAFIGFIQNHSYLNIGLILLLLFNLGGAYVGYLLVLKQMKITSSHADKICYLLSQSNCNDVLDSPAAKFMGIIGWSELGLGYFLSNTILIFFTPYLLPYLALFNILALPYSFWSIWYQKSKAKQWCPLCLIIQLLFWLIFIADLAFGFITIPELSIVNILTIGIVYSVPYLVISLILPKLAENRKIERISQEFNSLKMNEDLFLTSLKKQRKYDVGKEYSNIYFGNPNAKTMITIFSNPHCEPCARMHKRVDELLLKNGDKLCIQYIFSAFSEDLEDSNRFLLAINKHMSSEKKNEIYTEWFSKGKYEEKEFFQKYRVPMDNVEDELEIHKEWEEKTKLYGTPTILFEGYELPNNYAIEDLIYFVNLDIDAK